MVDKFPIYRDWLKGSTVVELINDRVLFVRPPLGVPEENDLFRITVLQGPGGWCRIFPRVVLRVIRIRIDINSF
jgi:hypothetical protein